MSNSKIKGITIELGGDTTKLDKALSTSEKQSKNLQSELKGINTLLKFDPSSIELITQKQQVLSEAIETTKGKLKTLQQAQIQVQQQFEKGEITAEQYRSFQREIVATEKKLSDLENQQNQLNSVLNQAENAYSSLTNKISNQENELAELKKEYANIVLEYGKSSDEAKNMAKQIKNLSDDLAGNITTLSKAENEAERFSESLKKANESAKDTDGYTVAKDVLADFASTAIQGVIDGIGNIISALGELPEATKEYRSMMAKLEGSTKTFGYSTDFSKEQFDKFYSYIGDNQMATNAITNLMGIGTSTESIAKIAEGAIGVWATYGDSIPIESLTESINETITVGKVTGTMADTINWAKVSQEELSKALSGNSKAQKAFNNSLKDGEAVEDAFSAALAATTNEQERADIVAQFLNSTYGESKKTYDEMTGSIQDAQTAENNLQEIQAELASSIEPMQTAFTNLKTKALELLIPIVEKISKLFQDLGKWMAENPAKAEALKGALLGIAAALGVLATALAISNLISLVQKAFALLNVTMLANPIVLIVAAISGLVAAFVYLWNNCEGFRDFWINLWEKIKEIVSGAIDFVVELFNKIVNFVKENWQGLLLLIANPFVGAFKLLYDNCEGFRNFIDNFVETIKNFFSEAWDTIVNIISVAIQLIASILDAAFQIITLPFRFIWENCKEIIFDVWENIKSAVSTAIEFVRSVITTVFTTIRDFFISIWESIKSVFTTVWNAILEFITPIIEAIKEKITEKFNYIKNTISVTINTIKSIITTVWNAISNVISSVVNTIKNVVTSVFDNLKNGVKTIWEGIKNYIITPISNAFDKIKSVVSNIKSTVVNTFNNLKSSVTSVFTNIKNAITTPIEKAKDVISGIVDKIKGFFNFKIEFPKIKLPHFSIKPKGWKVGDLLEGSIPKLGIEWYAKGAILKKPTIFGTNGNNVMVGGEKGTEAIAPISELLKYVKLGVDESLRETLFDVLTNFTNTRVQNQRTTIYGINELTSILKTYLPEIVGNMDKDLVMDGNKVGRLLAPTINKELGYIAQANSRGR